MNARVEARGEARGEVRGDATPADAPVTVVLVWATDGPEQQARLLDAMRADVPWMRTRPGFVSLALRPGADGTRVVVEGVWRSRADFDALGAEPHTGESRAEFGRVGRLVDVAVTAAGDTYAAEARGAADEARNRDGVTALLGARFEQTFRHDRIAANGTTLHVVSGGAGAPVVLLHGMLETWLVWHRVMPALAARYRVIVPDLRGFGDSERPEGGYDKTTLARDVLALCDALGLGAVHLVGHDFGAQVAYRAATLRRDGVRRLAVLEGLLPGVTPHTPLDPQVFWFVPFSRVPDLPEQLVAGRERAYLAYLYRSFLSDPSALSAAELDAYVAAYSRPGGLRAGFGLYRSMGQDAADFGPEYAQKLRMPVLALGGAQSFGPRVLETFRQVADYVEGGELERCAHFPPIEQPDELTRRLLAFLGADRPATAGAASPGDPS